MSDTISTDIRIARSIESVWEALTDFAGYGAWNPYLVRVEGEPRAGTVLTVHAVSAPGLEPMVQAVDVLSVDRPSTMRWEGGLPDRAQFKGDHWWVLEVESPSLTRVRHFEHFSGTLAGPILASHGGTIRANFDRFNRALKVHVESRA